jgi:tRNA1(Val) A37 N6-methylase TrmN6
MPSPHPSDIIETTLLRGQVKLLQPKHGFHASTDTVLLAAAAASHKLPAGAQVLDLGCGVGSAGLCFALKNGDIILNGQDIQDEMINLARRNAALNGMSEASRFEVENLLEDTVFKDNFFDLALTNPPFQAEGRHSPSPLLSKAMAHGEEPSGITLEKWCKYLHKKIKNGGYMVMVHRADRLDEIIRVLTARRWFGSLRVLPVYSRAGDATAKRVLVSARKERYASIILKSGLIMHEADGGYTAAAADILDGRAIIEM